MNTHPIQAGLRGLAMAAMALGAGLSTSAMAADSGVYVGLTVGKAKGSGRAYETGGDPSFGLALGYRINDQLAVEAFTRDLSFVRFLGIVTPPEEYQVPKRHTGLALEGTLPLNEGWGLYGRLGVGRTSTLSATTGQGADGVTDATLGGGLRYGLGSSWAFKLGAERYSKSKVNAYYLAVQYQF